MHYTISDFLLDIIQNSIEAGSGKISVGLEESENFFSFTVQDDGCGMDEQHIDRALDPFHSDGIKHPGRKVGLGLPFLKQALEDLDGKFSIESKKGIGTSVRASFPLDHIDTPPVGDLVACLVSALCFFGDYELVCTRKKEGDTWELSRSELQEALGDLDSVGSITLLREYLESLEDPHGKDNA